MQNQFLNVDRVELSQSALFIAAKFLDSTTTQIAVPIRPLATQNHKNDGHPQR